ncbi:MAG: hypothetical protein PUB05_03785 [Firmicutes bacterium]|nr:hypothetical protein [Bacillota bacterium]
MKKNKKREKVMAAVNAIIGDSVSKTDPNGSYTGVPAPGEGEVPVQDSDDL